MALKNNNHFKAVINLILSKVVGLQVIVRCFEKINALFNVQFSHFAAIYAPCSQ